MPFVTFTVRRGLSAADKTRLSEAMLEAEVAAGYHRAVFQSPALHRPSLPVSGSLAGCRHAYRHDRQRPGHRPIPAHILAEPK